MAKLCPIEVAGVALPVVKAISMAMPMETFKLAAPPADFCTPQVAPFTALNLNSALGFNAFGYKGCWTTACVQVSAGSWSLLKQWQTKHKGYMRQKFGRKCLSAAIKTWQNGPKT